MYVPAEGDVGRNRSSGRELLHVWEDIDLSYRITLGGYENWYFLNYPSSTTKEKAQKEQRELVFVFYNAMVIFAKKHFTETGPAALLIHHPRCHLSKRSGGIFSVFVGSPVAHRGLGLAVFPAWCSWNT